MVDDGMVLIAERLRDDLSQLKSDLKEKYANKNRQVTNEKLKAEAARLAEAWMVNLARHPDVTKHIPEDYLANLNIHFQRILVLSEKASVRNKYDVEIKEVLSHFTIDFVIPLKQIRFQSAPSTALENSIPEKVPFAKTIFVGHSFDPKDRLIVEAIIDLLQSLGFSVVTGEKPKANKISDKIRGLIDQQYSFLGIFTRRHKIAYKAEWTTSEWVIDEKAYAVAKNKKLVLLKEDGVVGIGGLQGDYEYIGFSPDKLQLLLIKIIDMLNISVVGFKE